MKLSEKKEILLDAAQFLIDNATLLGLVLTIEAVHGTDGKIQIVKDARPVRGEDGEYEKEPK